MKVRRMERLNERVLRFSQIIDVVALHGLIEKRQPEQHDEGKDEQQFQSAALRSVLSAVDIASAVDVRASPATASKTSSV